VLRTSFLYFKIYCFSVNLWTPWNC